MKKKILFIVLGLVLVLIIGGVLLFSFLNKEKVSITADEFKTSMQEKGFVVVDANEQFSQYDYIEQVYIAAPADYSFQIEFYQLCDDEYARAFFNNNKSIFESTKSNAAAESNVSLKNYSKYTLSTDKKFKVISRIDNTVIYLNVDSDKKRVVKDLLDDLGY